MTIRYQLEQHPIQPARLNEILELLEAVFPEVDPEGMWRRDTAWRIGNMPEFTLFEARERERLIGCKMGYAHTQTRYYSWLGGVHPEFRRRGIATELMRRQHLWLLENGYRTVETGARQDNHDMAKLNLASGFSVVGIRYKGQVPDVIYEKRLPDE